MAFKEDTWPDNILRGSHKLFDTLILPEPSKRPDALYVLKYAEFWSNETKWKFLITVSDLTKSNQNDKDVKKISQIFGNVKLHNLMSAKLLTSTDICVGRSWRKFECNWGTFKCRDLKLKLITS